MLCDSSRDSDSSPFFDDSDSSPVFFTLTRTRTKKSWLGPCHAWVQAVAAMPCCAFYTLLTFDTFFFSYSLLKLLDDKWGREKYLVCFHVLEDKEISNMWTTGLVTRTWFFFFDSDSDSDVMTRTWRWWLGLGLGLRGDDSDSDLTIWTRTQHWSSVTTCTCELQFIKLKYCALTRQDLPFLFHLDKIYWPSIGKLNTWLYTIWTTSCSLRVNFLKLCLQLQY